MAIFERVSHDPPTSEQAQVPQKNPKSVVRKPKVMPSNTSAEHPDFGNGMASLGGRASE